MNGEFKSMGKTDLSMAAFYAEYVQLDTLYFYSKQRHLWNNKYLVSGGEY